MTDDQPHGDHGQTTTDQPQAPPREDGAQEEGRAEAEDMGEGAAAPQPGAFGEEDLGAQAQEADRELPPTQAAPNRNNTAILGFVAVAVVLGGLLGIGLVLLRPPPMPVAPPPTPQDMLASAWGLRVSVGALDFQVPQPQSAITVIVTDTHVLTVEGLVVRTTRKSPVDRVPVGLTNYVCIGSPDGPECYPEFNPTTGPGDDRARR